MTKLYQTLVNYSTQQILIFGLVAGLVYYFLVFDDGSSMRSEIENFSQQISQEEARRKDTESTLKELERMKTAVGVLSQQYAEISKRLPTSLQSLNFNSDINNFARNAGVSIKSRKPLPVASREIVDEVPVQVTLEGNYGDLALFVYLVSAAERATSIRTFVVTPVEPRSSQLRFEGTVIGYQLSAQKTPAPGRPK